jgi:tetratricopeptide (TPR) repeat protein
VGYYQRGNTYYILEDYELALNDFQDCIERLRGNTFIDYNQLGLGYILHEAHVQFNLGLCYLALGDSRKGLDLFTTANESVGRSNKDPNSNKIRDGVKVGANAYQQVFPYKLDDTTLYRPMEDTVNNSKTVNYLGKSKVVAGADANNSFNGFSGRKVKEATLGRNYREKLSGVVKKEPPKDDFDYSKGLEGRRPDIDNSLSRERSPFSNTLQRNQSDNSLSRGNSNTLQRNTSDNSLSRGNSNTLQRNQSDNSLSRGNSNTLQRNPSDNSLSRGAGRSKPSNNSLARANFQIGPRRGSLASNGNLQSKFEDINGTLPTLNLKDRLPKPSREPVRERSKSRGRPVIEDNFHNNKFDENFKQAAVSPGLSLHGQDSVMYKLT